MAIYLGAACVPVAASIVLFWRAGALGDYLYWAGTYNVTSSYAKEASTPVPASEWPALLALFMPVFALAASTARSRAWWQNRGRFTLFTDLLLVAATLPIFPRYARFHLAAALPLLALIAGVATWNLVRHFPGFSRFRAASLLPWAVGALLILFTLRTTVPPGARALLAVWGAQHSPLPYLATAGPLSAWVQASVPAGRPILVYDLDPMLYRVLEREPPRPWSPLFPWILEGGSTSEQWAQGIESERPGVALVTPEFVAGRHLPLPDNGRSETFLRAHYVPGPHFTVRKYADSMLQEVVVLRLSGGADTSK